MVALRDSKQVKPTSKMKVPPSFDLGSLLQSNEDPPLPRKSRLRKNDLYEGPQKFRNVDDHVTKVSSVNHRSFRGFIWHLLHSNKNVTDDLGKIRAIYRWITTKSRCQQIFENKAGQNTAEFLISDFQKGKVSHAQVFKLLCMFSGLHCKIILGVAKGKDYRPGDSCAQEKYRHCWNAVNLNGNWFLVDCKWGTRNSKTDEVTSEFYFLTDPDQLLLSHLADDKNWQLVDRPITISEFDSLPFVKPHFYACGLHFMSNTKCVMETKRGQVKWDIGTKHPVKFSFRMTCADNGSDNMNGIMLRKFIYHEVQTGRATFALRTPSAGTYFLKLFARNLENNSCRDTRLLEVLEYKVHIDRTCIEDDPLPNCWDTTWGSTEKTERLCLYPVHKKGLITTEEKSIRFEINKTRPVNVLCRLHRYGWREDKLQTCVKLQDSEMKAYIEVKLPVSGEYGLEIFGCIANRNDTSFRHVCQYLIACQRRNEDVDETVIESFLAPLKNKIAEKNGPQEVTMNGDVFVDASETADAPSSFELTSLPDHDDSLPVPLPRESGLESEFLERKLSINDVEQHVQSSEFKERETEKLNDSNDYGSDEVTNDDGSGEVTIDDGNDEVTNDDGSDEVTNDNASFLEPILV